MKFRNLLFILPFLFTSSLVSCDTNTADFTISTTFAPIYDLTLRIVKDKAEVINLAKENEVHGFEINNMKDAAFTEKADILFALGLNVDSFAKNMSSKNYVEINEGVSLIEKDGVVDPHIWLSLNNAITMAENILDEVIKQDPENENFYRLNFETLKSEFSQLDKEYKGFFTSLGSEVKIVTSHDAFTYLCNDYRINQVSIRDMADNEASSQDYEKIISYIKENDIHTIFAEELDSSKEVDSIINTLKSQGYTDISKSVLNAYEGCSYESYENGDDYLSVMKDNLANIKESI